MSERPMGDPCGSHERQINKRAMGQHWKLTGCPWLMDHARVRHHKKLVGYPWATLAKREALGLHGLPMHEKLMGYPSGYACSITRRGPLPNPYSALTDSWKPSRRVRKSEWLLKNQSTQNPFFNTTAVVVTDQPVTGKKPR